MTSLTHSSITGLYHPKRSLNNSESSLSSNSSLIDNQKILIIDRILHADKSGFFPSDLLINSSGSYSNVDLSNSSSLSSVERSVFEAQIKRAISSNETMEASIKRIRTETQNSIEDLTNRNEFLERSLHESLLKICEYEHLLDKIKEQTINSSDSVTSLSICEQQIKILENDKLDLKLQLQQNKYLHSKEIIQLEKTINNLKHQLIDTENKLKLIEFQQDKLNSINKNNLNELNEKNNQIEQLQKRLIEFELQLSNLNSTNTINQTLINDIKQINHIQYENQQLKEQIQLFKLKCNEHILHNEQLYTLRQQTKTNDDYRILIAKKDEEILKLREQLENKNKIDKN